MTPALASRRPWYPPILEAALEALRRAAVLRRRLVAGVGHV